MNASKFVLAAVLLSSSLVFACGGSDSTGSDTGSSGSKKSSKNSDGDDDGESKTGTKTGDNDSTTTEKDTTTTCQGDSMCLNGACKCTSGPQKGKSCCYAPEEEDDPPCAKANLCDNVCNHCD